jgi:hypothetical protein
MSSQTGNRCRAGWAIAVSNLYEITEESKRIERNRIECQ